MSYLREKKERGMAHYTVNSEGKCQTSGSVALYALQQMYIAAKPSFLAGLTGRSLPRLAR
jgi:hypothetical protein